MAIDLDPIRARLAVLNTPSPWECRSSIPYTGKSVVVTPDDSLIVASEVYSDDAIFIAHAPEDTAALVAEVERLRAQLMAERDTLRTMVSQLHDELAKWFLGESKVRDETEALLAEAERLLREPAK